ncbi:MAG: thymidine phosphorylase [Verrucomicrobiota bacterium]|nr:thymidine phosphorylase [Verrucomicrobiota bacterium]
MIPQWIIEKKRDGNALSEEEIRSFIAGYARGDIPECQMAALAMAIFFRSMSFDEVTVLTDAMMRSGATLDTASVPQPKIDKHSTGGVGDKVSLSLAPLVACCGVAVPMISGCGLGITGGTLDKLESIPGYRADLSIAEFLEVVRTCGCSIIGQTAELAPADKKLYALRDVTGTVPSIPLIAASIMSKKFAEGIDGLALDVKWGKGAFMKTRPLSRALAQTMLEIGRRMGKRMTAVITDMNQPLGRAVGNALEIAEIVDVLCGRAARPTWKRSPWNLLGACCAWPEKRTSARPLSGNCGSASAPAPRWRSSARWSAYTAAPSKPLTILPDCPRPRSTPNTRRHEVAGWRRPTREFWAGPASCSAPGASGPPTGLTTPSA